MDWYYKLLFLSVIVGLVFYVWNYQDNAAKTDSIRNTFCVKEGWAGQIREGFIIYDYFCFKFQDGVRLLKAITMVGPYVFWK
jgi:hypothetical protein